MLTVIALIVIIVVLIAELMLKRFKQTLNILADKQLSEVTDVDLDLSTGLNKRDVVWYRDSRENKFISKVRYDTLKSTRLWELNVAISPNATINEKVKQVRIGTAVIVLVITTVYLLITFI